MKIVELDLLGHPLHLFFNGEALFALQERFGENYVNVIFPEDVSVDRDGLLTYWGNLLEAAAILAEQGELARRTLGYDAETLTHLAVLLGLLDSPLWTPADGNRLAIAVDAAIAMGLRRDYTPSEDIDLTLMELESKNAMPG